jgi:hypothetical protein
MTRRRSGETVVFIAATTRRSSERAELGLHVVR